MVVFRLLQILRLFLKIMVWSLLSLLLSFVYQFVVCCSWLVVWMQYMKKWLIVWISLLLFSFEVSSLVCCGENFLLLLMYMFQLDLVVMMFMFFECVFVYFCVYFDILILSLCGEWRFWYCSLRCMVILIVFRILQWYYVDLMYDFMVCSVLLQVCFDLKLVLMSFCQICGSCLSWVLNMLICWLFVIFVQSLQDFVMLLIVMSLVGVIFLFGMCGMIEQVLFFCMLVIIWLLVFCSVVFLLLRMWLLMSIVRMLVRVGLQILQFCLVLKWVMIVLNVDSLDM